MTEPRLTAEEILREFHKGRISARMRDGMLRAEGYELAKDGDGRFKIEREGNGWRVVDTETGHLHSARIHERWRAQAQANTMNQDLKTRRHTAPRTPTGAEGKVEA